MQYYDFGLKKVVDDDRPEIEELAEMYGTIDLLTAYTMRHLNCSKKEAQDKTWEIHECVDRMLDGDDAIATKDTVDTITSSATPCTPPPSSCFWPSPL